MGLFSSHRLDRVFEGGSLVKNKSTGGPQGMGLDGVFWDLSTSLLTQNFFPNMASTPQADPVTLAKRGPDLPCEEEGLLLQCLLTQQLSCGFLGLFAFPPFSMHQALSQQEFCLTLKMTACSALGFDQQARGR